jgi:ribosomal protein S8
MRILGIFEQEGFIEGYTPGSGKPKVNAFGTALRPANYTEICVQLKYANDGTTPALSGVKVTRASGKQNFVKASANLRPTCDLPSGFRPDAAYVFSTNHGVLGGAEFRSSGVGGELLLYAW